MLCLPGRLPKIDKSISVKWIPTIFSGVRPPAPLLKVQILFLKGALIKSGETYFGRNLVFPGQIGSLFRAGCCQPSWVKRKVKGPLLKAISAHHRSVTFGSKCQFHRKMVLHFYASQNPDHLIRLCRCPVIHNQHPIVCVGSVVISCEYLWSSMIGCLESMNKNTE